MARIKRNKGGKQNVYGNPYFNKPSMFESSGIPGIFMPVMRPRNWYGKKEAPAMPVNDGVPHFDSGRFSD